ncbi:MAG: EAL domain-containing protein [Pseudomonadota bacterium]
MSRQIPFMKVPRGEVLFREGDAGQHAYAIESGLVQICVERSGKRVAVANLGKGEIFGEMAIISEGPRSATAVALEDCQLLRLEAQQFHHRMEAMDPVMRMVVDVMLSRLRRTLEQLDSLPENPRMPEEPPAELVEQALTQLRLEHELSDAIADEQFAVFYQPIVCLASGKLAGFEALVRWNHPRRGMISPDSFLPAAERSDLILEITKSVLGTISRDLPELRMRCLKNIENVKLVYASLNVTARDLADAQFAEKIEAHFVEHGMTTDALRLEVTESSLMANLEETDLMLSRLRRLGVGIAIDDFGTGYSSMNHLAQLPISTLKIDKSFVAAMNESDQSRKIVNAILRLAKELGIPVVAEGIETKWDARYLAREACEFGQGYFYGKPVPLEAALKLIANWRAKPVLPQLVHAKSA